MFTPDSLLQMAIDADVRYQALALAHPTGVNDERSEARELRDKALACAAWMEKFGLTERAAIGPFAAFVPSKGQRVRVKKGAVITGTNPQTPRDGVASTRDQIVTVNWAHAGFIDHGRHFSRREEDAMRDGEVTWVGAGGYWRRASLNDVVPIDAVETAGRQALRCLVAEMA